MNDEEFELHKAALREEGIVVEAKITGRSDRANNEVHINIVVQSDDFPKVGPKEIKVGWDYQIVFFEKGPTPPKPKRPRKISQPERSKVRSDSTVGTTPAPGGDSSARALSDEIDDAATIYAKSIAKKYNSICHARRNDPRFRGFLFDYFKTPMLRDPVASIEWVKQKQHELLNVEHCSRIYPDTYAEKMFYWLESAFESDKHNLPIPKPPGGTDEAA